MARESLVLQNLAERHPGLTPEVAGFYCQAASVCLSRHHMPPTEITILWREAEGTRAVDWVVPDSRTVRAWANDIDATEMGAYGILLAVVEVERGLVAIARAETLTGADHYVGPAGWNGGDLEDSFRLEVSGTDRGNIGAVTQRLKAKIDQAAKGRSDLPAIAAVVGFKERIVAVADVYVT
jgi:hypothetical protein